MLQKNLFNQQTMHQEFIDSLFCLTDFSTVFLFFPFIL